MTALSCWIHRWAQNMSLSTEAAAATAAAAECMCAYICVCLELLTLDEPALKGEKDSCMGKHVAFNLTTASTWLTGGVCWCPHAERSAALTLAHLEHDWARTTEVARCQHGGGCASNGSSPGAAWEQGSCEGSWGQVVEVSDNGGGGVGRL